MIHERDRETDGQTPHDDMGRAYASHRAAKTGSLDAKITSIVGLLAKIEDSCLVCPALTKNNKYTRS